MAISYNKLWQLMEEKNITQKDLSLRCSFPPNVITRMRQGEYVSLEMLDKICDFLGCDYGDIITRRKDDVALPPITCEEDYLNAMDKVRSALKIYMRECEQSISDIHEITSLSVNTIKGFLNGNIISSLSYWKLLKLGDIFAIILNKKLNELKMESRSRQETDAMTFMQKEIVVVSYAVYINLIRQVPQGRLTRREDIEAYVAKQLNAKYIDFQIKNKIIVWKNLPGFRETIPYWREVSKIGYLQDTLNCSKIRQEYMLQQEGYKILPCGARKASLKVENYENYLFDFEKELKIDFDRLKSMDID